MKNYDKYEKKLNEMNKIMDNEHEIFLPIKDFDGYEVSNFGRVKSIKRKVLRTSPNKQKVFYSYGNKFLKPLYAGNTKEWLQVRLSKNSNWKQMSIAKLMISTFLNISITKLPRNVFVKDGDPLHLQFSNFTFYKPSKIKKNN